MKVLGVIPARYHSTRLPAKLLIDIAGKPMVQHVYERAQKAKLLDELIIATDDDRIVSAVQNFGGRVVLTSPNHASGTDRVAEVAASSDADIVVNVQGDEPLLNPQMIDECVQALESALHDQSGIEFSTLIKPAKESEFHDQGVVKVVRDLKGRALYFSRSMIPFPRHQAGTLRVFVHIGLYAYTKDCLVRLSHLKPSPLEQAEGLEQLRALENGIGIQTIETKCHDELISVDSMEELSRVRDILTKRTEPHLP